MPIQVKYAGKRIPQDFEHYTEPVIDPNVPYDNNTLPADAVKFVASVADPSNQPGLVIMSANQSSVTPYVGTSYAAPHTGDILPNGAVVLPGDVIIRGYVEKVIAETTIVDGVEVTEHIRRTPYFIDFEFTIWGRQGQNQFFNQNFLNYLDTKIIMPEGIIYVANTLLNSKGITQLIVKRSNFETVRASVKIPLVIKCKENMQGQSLIVSQ
jgi:hypothetical protein